MGMRVIRQPVNDMFEEAAPMERLIRKPSPAARIIEEPVIPKEPVAPREKPIIDHSSPDAIDLERFEYVAPKKKLKLPSLQMFRFQHYEAIGVFVMGIKLIISCSLIYIGLTTTGSFFGPASGKFGGQLAMFMYQYQLGTLVAMIGAIVGYDAIRFR